MPDSATAMGDCARGRLLAFGRRENLAALIAGNKGVTLVEMMIVVAIIALIVGISFPSVSGGLDAIRLTSAADSTAGFLNGALNRAERVQEAVELAVSIRENRISMRSNTLGFARILALPDGVSVAAVHPDGETGDQPRRFVFLPGAAAPRVGIELTNRRGGRRIVRVDPVTGVPQVER